jgi:hypothetical protein
MNLTEKLPLLEINFLNTLSFEDFKPLCKSSTKNDEERKKQFNMLKSFCETNIKTRGETKRVYAYTLTTPLDVGGRLYCGNSLQGLPKHIRGFLMKNVATDIDMKNAHPVILRYICKLNNIPCPNLNWYIEHRDEILSEMGSEYKTEFLKAVNDDKINRKVKDKFFKDFDKEMKQIQSKVTKLPEYQHIVDSVPLTRTYNWNGSAINRILCVYENKILQSLIDILSKKNIEICALMFDGLMIYGNFYEDCEFLKSITDEINEIYDGLNMVWTYKEHSDLIKMPEEFEIPEKQEKVQLPTANCDKDCAELIINLLKDKMVYTNGVIFYKNKNIWTNDITLIENMLIVFIMENSPYRETKFGLIRGYTDLSDVKPVIKTIFAKISTTPDDTIYNKFHSTTKGRLAFLDGVLCALTKKFYRWEEIDFEYYSTICISREYCEYLFNPDWDLMEHIIDKIFKPLFDKDWELALNFLSRALMGHTEDKNWATFIGNRNSGKGVSYELMKNACGDYVGSFKIDNILVQRECNGKETSKDLYWLLELEFMRLAVAQETPPDSNKYKISAPLLKKICSGGDTQIARRNYDRKDTHFITDATMLMMGNDYLECSSADCNEHRFQFNSIIQFKKAEQIEELKELNLPDNIIDERYGIIDYSLKEKCRSDEWCNAFILMVMRYYKNEPLSVFQKKEDEIDDNEKPLILRIYEILEITNNEEDIALASDVDNLFMNEKKKLALELKGLGVNKKRNKGRGLLRDKICYFGLKIKDIVEEEN